MRPGGQSPLCVPSLWVFRSQALKSVRHSFRDRKGEMIGWEAAAAARESSAWHQLTPSGLEQRRDGNQVTEAGQDLHA